MGPGLRRDDGDAGTTTGLRPQTRRFRIHIAGAEIVVAEVGQLAFQAFDVQPQRPAMVEQQQRAAARGSAGWNSIPTSSST